MSSKKVLDVFVWISVWASLPPSMASPLLGQVTRCIDALREELRRRAVLLGEPEPGQDGTVWMESSWTASLLFGIPLPDTWATLFDQLSLWQLLALWLLFENRPTFLEAFASYVEKNFSGK